MSSLTRRIQKRLFKAKGYTRPTKVVGYRSLPGTDVKWPIFANLPWPRLFPKVEEA